MSPHRALLACLLTATLLAPSAHAQYYDLTGRDRINEQRAFTPYPSRGSGPFRHEFRQAARDWPDARACLTPAQQTAGTADITRLDWRKITTRLDAEACLFRVLETLVTPQDGRRWMVALGLEDIRLRERNVIRVRAVPHRRAQDGAVHTRPARRTRSVEIELCGTNDPTRSGRVLVRTLDTAVNVSQYLYGGETFCARYSRNGILRSTSYLVKGLGDYPQSSPATVTPKISRTAPTARPVYRSRND